MILKSRTWPELKVQNIINKKGNRNGNWNGHGHGQNVVRWECGEEGGWWMVVVESCWNVRSNGRKWNIRCINHYSRVYALIPICLKQSAWNSPRVTRKWVNPNHSPQQRLQPHILHWCTHSLDVSNDTWTITDLLLFHIYVIIKSSI